MRIRSAFILLSMVALAACGPSNSSLPSQDHSLLNDTGAENGNLALPADKASVVKIVDGFNRSCTGTLISSQIVLTAAHCIKDAGDLEIFFAAEPSISVMSKELVPHEQFETVVSKSFMKIKNEHKNDIGLIWLENSAPKKAIPALMPEATTSPGMLIVRAVGYGRTGSDHNDGGILRADNLEAMIRAEEPSYFFFDQTQGKGVCQGDSGGPLFIEGNGINILVGVINGADDLEADFLSGEPVGDTCRYTGVGTQVAVHKEWIKQKSKELNRKYLSVKISTFDPRLNTDQAYCRPAFPTHEEMKAEITKMSLTNAAQKAAVGGLLLKDENPRLIEAYRYLVSYKTYKFKIEKDIDMWDLFKDGQCDKALCAAQTVFGSEDGVLYLYVAAKYGLVLSSLGLDRLKPPKPEDQTEFDAYFKVRPWKKGELAPYLKALPMLPEMGLPMPFTRMNHAGIVNPVNSNVLSNGIIQFYTPIDAMSASHKEQTTFHELGHNYGTYYRLDSSKEWLQASGWEVQGKKYVNARPQEFVSAYASGDFFEDFAESFTYYRYYPHLLKERSPSRYEYFKKTLFGGKEFLSVSDCR